MQTLVTIFLHPPIAFRGTGHRYGRQNDPTADY